MVERKNRKIEKSSYSRVKKERKILNGKIVFCQETYEPVWKIYFSYPWWWQWNKPKQNKKLQIKEKSGVVMAASTKLYSFPQRKNYAGYIQKNII